MTAAAFLPFCFSVSGTPYAQLKRRGDVAAPRRWSEAVVAATAAVPRVTSPCELQVVFRLPGNKFPADLPYGSDLDNLLKRLLDALNETVFKDARGHDSAVVRLVASKIEVADEREAGVDVTILPVPQS